MLICWQTRIEEAYHLAKFPKADERISGRQQSSVLCHGPKRYADRRENIESGNEHWGRRVMGEGGKDGRLMEERKRGDLGRGICFTFLRVVIARAYDANRATIH